MLLLAPCVDAAGVLSEAPLAPPARYQSIPALDAPDIEQRWWQGFGDPTLDALIAEAARGNQDVHAALARAQQARAAVTVATADLLPTIAASGTAYRSTTTYSAPILAQLPNVSAERAGLSASWDLDLFGRARANRRAAQADRLAAEDARRGALLLALSDTAEQYFVLRGTEEQLKIVQDLVATERETVRLTELRRTRGAASELDLDRVHGELSDTEATLPPLSALITVTQNRLAVLTGAPPGALNDQLSSPTAPVRLPALPHAEPATLLERRPDVMAAAAALTAAAARYDAARAARWPDILSSVLLGTQWTNVNAVDIGRARFTNAAAAINLPLFTGGRITGAIHAANAAEREALAEYDETLLKALEDVEAAMTSAVQSTRRAALLESSVHSRAAALAKAQSMYAAGEIDLMQLLDVERALLAVRLAACANETARLTDAVRTYRALGGGWEAFEPAGAEITGLASAHGSQ